MNTGAVSSAEYAARLCKVAEALREQLAILDFNGAFAAAAPLSLVIDIIERELQSGPNAS